MLQTAPVAKSEEARCEHQRLRWRLMYGLYKPDVLDRLKKAIGHIRQKMWEPVDLSANPFLQVHGQSAALYNQEPQVRSELSDEQEAQVLEALDGAGYWQLMQRVQRDTLALREIPVHIGEPNEDGEIIFRPVPPFRVEVKCRPSSPRTPYWVAEWDQDPDDDQEWLQWVWDLSDPAAPVYKVVDRDGVDHSERVLGGVFAGERYPWMGTDGPVMPWVTYHAAQTGWFWDPYTGREVVEGSLQLLIYYTLFGHLLRNASWAQRYHVGVEPVGGETEDGGEVRTVTADPSSSVGFQHSEQGTGQALIGQWSAPADPEKFLSAVRSYEKRLVDMALGTAQVSRASSDIRSGYSLAVSREAQRELQRSFEPVFKRTDRELLDKVRALLGLPKTKWRISYQAIPKDPTELKAELDQLLAKVEAGLLDKVSAYMELHPGLNRAEAEEAVRQIEEINRGLAPTEEEG